MAKFMLSLREENYQLLGTEAQERGISIQELIRAVIIPDWVKLSGATPKIETFPVQENSYGRQQIIQSIGGVRKFGDNYSRQSPRQ